MSYYINSETISTIFSSCNCPMGYLFVKEHFHEVKSLLNQLSKDLILSNTKFDIGFLKWNPISNCCGIVTQKLTNKSTFSFIFPLLFEVDILIVDEEWKPYVRTITEKNNLAISYVKNQVSVNFKNQDLQ